MIETSKRDTIKAHEAYYNHGILSWLSKAISGRENRNKYDITINGNIAANNFTDALGYPMSWYTTLGTFSFNAWDSTVRTGTINTSANLTGLIKVGNKLRFTQSGTVKYAIVTAITLTTITCFLPNGSTLDTGVAVTDMYFSNIAQPFGFPLDPTNWTLQTISTADVAQGTPTNGIWYNIGGINLPIGIGVWRVKFSCPVNPYHTSAVPIFQETALSTSTSSVSDNTLKVLTAASNVLEVNQTIYKESIITLTSKTTYNLIDRTLLTLSAIRHLSNNYNIPTIISAECAYL